MGKRTAKWVGLVLVALFGCGGGGGGDPREDAFELLEEGTGEANVDTLQPLRSGTVLAFRRGTIRAPIEFAPDRVGYRYFNEASAGLGTAPVDGPSENWLSEDESGVWFEGSTKGGVLDVPILLVPATVRVGMRWRTGGGSAREYEVTRRDEVDTVLGPTVLWTIVQETETPIYRLYAEGWGVVDVLEGAEPSPATWESFVAMRSITGTDFEPAQSMGPALELREVMLDGLPELTDSLRAVRLPDGRTVINVAGVSTGLTGPRLGATNILYDAGDLTLMPTVGDFDHFPSSVDATRVSPWSVERAYEIVGTASGSNVFGIGNVVHLGDRIVWSVEESVLFENELGGVSATFVDTFAIEGNFRFELTAVPPGYGEAFTMRPSWGGLHYASGRVLLAGDATPAQVPFARVAGPLGELWTATSNSFADGRLISAPRFVEAFPDAYVGGRGGFRAPSISTTSGPGSQVHLFTTPGGIVDRVVVDATGARRERLGRATLPDGHELMAAGDMGDGSLVLLTFARDTESTHTWIADGADASPTSPDGFVSLTWSRWDARVCWPATTELLDASSWRLGPVAAAAVVPEGDNCAIVVRGLEAMPIPRGSYAGDPSLDGWLVFEGDVPGVGHVRAFEPYEGAAEMRLPALGAWLSDGGSIATVFGPSESASVRFSPGGVPLGRVPHVEFAGGVPDQSGAGLWAYTSLRSWPDGHCGPGCAPDSTFAIALTGPETHTWLLESNWDPQFMIPQSGGALIRNNVGILADTTHVGWVHLRTDGSLVEITLPDIDDAELRTVRTNGEVCGSATEFDGSLFNLVWCAQPDGSGARTGRMPERAVASAMHLLDEDTALAQSPFGAPWLVDLDSLTTRPYPDSGSVAGALQVGADGVTYGSFTPEGGPSTLGAFRLDGFVPLSEIYDASALALDEPEVSGVFITEHFAYVSLMSTGVDTLRIPRVRWDGVGACTPTTAPDLDADGDGFIAATSCGRDCDDSDIAINPDADEVCDGVDNDCNGVSDEVGGTCWVDTDEDGFALASAAPMTACSCPAGTTTREPVDDDVDCADEDERAFPGQTEFFGTAITGVRVSGIDPYDFDCNGTEEGRWPISSCTITGAMMCERTEGFAGFAPCGSPSRYQGCPDPDEPTLCGGGCTYDLAGFCTQVPSDVLWTQECR